MEFCPQRGLLIWIDTLKLLSELYSSRVLLNGYEVLRRALSVVKKDLNRLIRLEGSAPPNSSSNKYLCLYLFSFFNLQMFLRILFEQQTENVWKLQSQWKEFCLSPVSLLLWFCLLQSATKNMKWDDCNKCILV